MDDCALQLPSTLVEHIRKLQQSNTRNTLMSNVVALTIVVSSSTNSQSCSRKRSIESLIQVSVILYYIIL